MNIPTEKSLQHQPNHRPKHSAKDLSKSGKVVTLSIMSESLTDQLNEQLQTASIIANVRWEDVEIPGKVEELRVECERAGARLKAVDADAQHFTWVKAERVGEFGGSLH